jgi:GMP synthase (glutamine-hydrolysing)
VRAVAEQVAVLDFGAQYAQLIARRIREVGFFARLWPPGTPARELRAAGVAAVVLSGGPASVHEAGAPTPDPELLASGLPLLGICYGHQVLAHLLGGRVIPAREREYGPAELEVLRPEGVLAGLGPREPVWMSHGDLVLQAPEGFRVLGRTASTPVAAMGDPVRRIYGVQFHPEVQHTPCGRRVLENFLRGVAGLEGTWSPGSFVERAVGRIRDEIGGGRAVAALSGGVDSAVATALVHRAIGDRLTAIFVDHGLLRAGEAEEVVRAFRDVLPLRLVHVRARERFLARLAGVVDPEAKRRAIGEEFIRVFEEEAARLGPVDFLVQGTVYPDVVESGRAAGATATIKTHHNVGGLPERMRLRVVEPLRELFKDEVRRVGEELGLPPSLVWRQPFPGPGLAIRVLGEVTAERLEVVRRADAIVREEVAAAGLDREVWQFFAVLTGARSVGVQGDGRTYAEVVAVRAVTSEDGMTADWARLPHPVLARISARICNEVPQVGRVVYDVTSKPPATIEWE